MVDDTVSLPGKRPGLRSSLLYLPYRSNECGRHVDAGLDRKVLQDLNVRGKSTSVL